MDYESVLAGANQDQLQQAYARLQQNMQPQQQSGNWFTRALPTIGSIAAPVIAGALAPETGGLSLLAEGALAAGGSAAGKAAENIGEGQDVTSGVGGAALEGGIGGGIGKGLGLAGKFATNMLDKTGTNLVGKSMFGDAPKPIRIANKARQTTGNILDYGIKPGDLPAAIEKTTYGDNAALNNGVRRAYANANPVDLSNVNDTANEIANQLEVAKPGSGKALVDLHNANMNRLFPDIPGVRSTPLTAADPTGTYDYMRNLQKAAFAKGLDPNVKSAYTGLANHLDQQLTKAGADKAVANGAVFTPEDIAQLHSVSPKLAQSALSQTTAGGVRSLMAPFAKAKTLLDAADAQGEALGSTGSGKIVPTAAKAILGNPTGQRVAGTAMRNTAKVLDSIGNAPVGSTTVGAAVPAVAGQVAGHATDFSSPQAALASGASPASPTPDSGTPQDMSGASAPTSPDAPGASGFTDSQLQQMLDADLQTGGQHSSTIQGLMKMNQASEKAANPPISAVTKRMYSQVTAADARLNDFQGLMDKVVNQSGPGALLTGLARSAAGSANLDTDAKNFNETRSEMALSIARALSGGNTQGSEAMLKRIEGYIPNITDSKESAAAKMTMLHQMLGDTKQSILSAPNYGDTGSSAFAADPSQVSFAQ